MPGNQSLTHLSDLAFASAVAIYVLAMLLHLAEFAFAKPNSRSRATAGNNALATVGGGRSSSTAGGESAAGAGKSSGDRGERALSERLGGMAVAITVLGAVVHLGSSVARGVALHRWPMGNLYEFGSTICLAAVVAWLVVLYRQTRSVRKTASSPRIRGLGGFVLLPILILLFLCGTVLYVKAGPLVPSLQSYWITIHVTAATISGGVLLFAGVASVMYLVRARYENNPMKFTRVGERLPTTQTLDRMAYRSTVFVFPLWTFAIIAGGIWAESAWGRFWGWDPKETTAFIAWIVYAAYLHARATAGWRGMRAAWVNILGFAVMVFNLFFVNFVVTGLHSYAGV